MVITTFVFTYSLRAEDELTFLPDEMTTDSSDTGYYDENEKVQYRKIKRTSKRNKLDIPDKAFSDSSQTPTYGSLLSRIIFVVLFLVGALMLIKIFLSRERVGKPGSLFEEIAHKFSSGFSPNQSLKLKQTLILMPGQNLYVVEVEGKKLLLGGTHQGGVQFLADLTNQHNGSIHSSQFIPQNLSQEANGDLLVELPTNSINERVEVETPFLENERLMNMETMQRQKVASLKNSKSLLNKRSNFRQSLLYSKGKTSDELVTVQR